MRSKLVTMVFLMASSPAFAGATMSVTGPGGANSLTLPYGTTQFDIDFQFSCDVPWVGMDAALEDVSPSYTNPALSIKGRVTHGDGVTAPPPTGVLTNNEQLFGPLGILDRVSADIGYFDFNVSGNYPPGDYILATLTIKNASTPADDEWIMLGTYKLQIGDFGAGINVANLAGESIPVTLGPILTVVVLPEPVSLLLLAFGGVFALRRR